MEMTTILLGYFVLEWILTSGFHVLLSGFGEKDI